MINLFRGKYYFLSNFCPCKVEYNGIVYSNSEAAFQAQKLFNRDQRYQFMDLSPNDSKRLGKQVQLRSDWESIKDNIMYEIVKAKFEQNKQLKELLINTNNEKLEEGNMWGDREWGTVNGIGKNKLGNILMRVRDEIKEDQNE